MTIHGQPVDATFPDIGRVIPQELGPIADIGFNPKYLGAFVKVHKILGLPVGIKFEFTGGNTNPQKISAPGYTAYLMPMRV